MLVEPISKPGVSRRSSGAAIPMVERVVPAAAAPKNSGGGLGTGGLIAIIAGAGGVVVVVVVLALVLFRGSPTSRSRARSADSDRDSSGKATRKESDGEDAPAPASGSRADAGQRVYRNLLKSATFIINQEIIGKEKVWVTGSGSLIDKEDRLVLTNYHVVDESPHVVVFFPQYSNRKLIAERSAFFKKVTDKHDVPIGNVVARNRKADLALIQLPELPGGVVPLNFAKRAAVPGQRVHSIGNPGSSEALWLYTSGTVRQVSQKTWRSGGGGKVYTFDAHVVETQSPTNSGDSGGPLVNDQGDLVAVTEGGSTQAQLMSIFIHVDEVRALVDAYKSHAGSSDSAPSSGSRKRKSKP